MIPPRTPQANKVGLAKTLSQIIFLWSVLLGSGVGCIQLNETPWKSINLGKGTLEVRLQEAIGPAAFAPEDIVFYYRDERGERFLATTVLCNDGASPSDHNLEATELENGNWQIILKGQEQADETWLVELTENGVKMKRLDTPP